VQQTIIREKLTSFETVICVLWLYYLQSNKINLGKEKKKGKKENGNRTHKLKVKLNHTTAEIEIGIVLHRRRKLQHKLKQKIANGKLIEINRK
jgi:hypothetical protein